MISCFQSATTLLYSAKFPDVKHFSTTERRTYLTPSIPPPPKNKIKSRIVALDTKSFTPAPDANFKKRDTKQNSKCFINCVPRVKIFLEQVYVSSVVFRLDIFD